MTIKTSLHAQHNRLFKHFKDLSILPILIIFTLLLPKVSIAQDSDGDGVNDAQDNCTKIANPLQRDSNGDGYGNVCDADLDNNGSVSFADLDLFRSAFGTNNAEADFDGNGSVSFADLEIFKALFGKPPGPAGSPDNNLSKVDAARFLTQSTFGPTEDTINELVTLNDLAAWIDNQMTLPISRTLPYVRSNSNGSNGKYRHEIWWINAIEGQDQLRQRVAFALSEIFVISDLDYTLANSQYGMSNYYDMLAENAFGNYRELLEKVTLHPTMGIYLSMLRNEKANPDRNVRPDENFAREILQLFSVGLYELNTDGSIKNDGAGNPIPSYTQTTVEQFAKVFTGWNFANTNDWTSNDLTTYDKETPMVPWEQFHDSSEKTLLNRTLPAGQTATQDLSQALNDIFLHPNVGPFISKHLIQRLVTSNPSPAYIARVAQAFNNNGTGVRGDLGAVTTAVLLDDEARNGHTLLPTQFGKIKEPLLRLTHFWRALIAAPGPDANGIYRTGAIPPLFIDTITGQAVLKSPSVFNFFLPNFSLSANTSTTSQNLVAPELQIMTEANIAATNNDYHQSVYSYNNHQDGYREITRINIDRELDLATNTDDLISHLDLLLLSASMSSAMKQQLKEHLDSLSSSDDGLYYKAVDAIYMIVASPAYMIQR
jgi:uncharacterized protein (DUF1800 family)